MFKNQKIICDKIIKLTGVGADEKCPYCLRRMLVWDREHQTEIVLFTNHLDFAPGTIAPIYKDRWAIETFFKTWRGHGTQPCDP